MSPCISLNRAKHSGGFLPRTGGSRRLGVSCPCPVLGSLVTSPPKRHRWAFVGRLPHPRSSSLGLVPPPTRLPGLGACEGPSRPAAVARPGQRAPVPRRAPCCTPHTPSPTELLSGGSLRRFTDARKGRPRSQGSGEQGAGQGTAFGQSSEAEGLHGEQDSRVPPARPPGPQAGRGEGSREVVAPTPTSSVSAWLGRDRVFPLQGASQGQSRLSRHGPPGLAGLSSSKEANLFFIQNPYKTIEQ